MGLDVNLSVRDKKVLIVGGGKAALLKLNKILAEGAVVTVLAPRILTEIANRKVCCLRREYREDDEEGYFLVVCATDDVELNESIVSRCQKADHLALNCSGPGDIRMHAACEAGDLKIVVSGCHGNPGFSRYLARLLSAAVDDGMLRRYRLHSQLRQILIAKDDPEKREKLNEALTMHEAGLVQWIERENDGN